MKDQGKLDETKVTDGRLLLAATVNTRGWSMEDRIYAAVEAMETERGKAQIPLICEKFHYDRLRNDRALGNRKSDNNKNSSSVGELFICSGVVSAVMQQAQQRVAVGPVYALIYSPSVAPAAAATAAAVRQFTD